jgi:hypothetical protein
VNLAPKKSEKKSEKATSYVSTVDYCKKKE